MSLATDVLTLRDRTALDLTSAHDHFAYSRSLWSEVVLSDASRSQRGPVLVNPATGSRAAGPNRLPVVTAAAEVYLPSAAVGQLVSITESFVTDLVRLWVIAHPFQLKGSVDVPTIVAAADKAAIVEYLADQYVASLAFKAPREWFKQVNAIVLLGVPADPMVEAFAEVKASRDVFVHNRGVANDIYLRKAGPLARAAVGQPIDLPSTYVDDAYRLCQQIVADVGTAATARA